MATNGNVNFQEGHVDQSASQQPSSTSSSNIGKDEVGWYFVEQFYTTLSRSPEKLHVSPLAILTYLENSDTFFSFSTARVLSSFMESRPRSPTLLLDGRYAGHPQLVARFAY